MKSEDAPNRPQGRGLAAVFGKGICMGIADVIPGVSGGTVALLLGITGRLVAAIRMIATPTPWLILARGEGRLFLRAVSADFLCALAAGIFAAVFLFAHLLHQLLESHAHLLLGFFFGLVAASVFAVLMRLQNHRAIYIPIFFAAAFLAFLIVSLRPADGIFGASPDLSAFFISGALAICAMILPGISGSFILLILGMYPEVLSAVRELKSAMLLTFAMGCGIGLLLFSHFLHFLLRRFHDATLAALAGAMLGAIPALWPWKEKVGGAKAILSSNVSPAEFAIANGESNLPMILILAIAGMILVFIFEFAGRKKSNIY